MIAIFDDCKTPANYHQRENANTCLLSSNERSPKCAYFHRNSLEYAMGSGMLQKIKFKENNSSFIRKGIASSPILFVF